MTSVAASIAVAMNQAAMNDPFDKRPPSFSAPGDIVGSYKAKSTHNQRKRRKRMRQVPQLHRCKKHL